MLLLLKTEKKQKKNYSYLLNCSQLILVENFEFGFHCLKIPPPNPSQTSEIWWRILILDLTTSKHHPYPRHETSGGQIALWISVHQPPLPFSDLRHLVEGFDFGFEYLKTHPPHTPQTSGEYLGINWGFLTRFVSLQLSEYASQTDFVRRLGSNRMVNGILFTHRCPKHTCNMTELHNYFWH